MNSQMVVLNLYSFSRLNLGTRSHVGCVPGGVFFIDVPQRLDARDLGQSIRYCDLVNIYHTWDGGTDHGASLVSHSTQCVAVLGGLH